MRACVAVSQDLHSEAVHIRPAATLVPEGPPLRERNPVQAALRKGP